MKLFLCKVKPKTKNLKKLLPIAVLGFFMLALLIKPEIYTKSVFEGILLYVTAVLPCLFPFFFFSKALTALGVGNIGDAFKKPLKMLYNSPPSGGYIFLLSILSGYPVGARLLADAYQSNLVDTKQAKCISSFTSTSAPLFVVGTVASQMYGDKILGVLILICHYLSALFNGFLYRAKKDKNSNSRILPLPSRQAEMLGDCVYNSIISVLVVGGYIALMNLVIDVMINSQILAVLALPFAKLLPNLGITSEAAVAIVAGLFEVTKGCLMLTSFSLSRQLLLPLLTGLISFGGLCIIFQSSSFLSKCGIKPAFIVKCKATQAVIAILLATIISQFL